MQAKQHDKKPWSWVPSLYFTEALPYFVVVVMSGIMYKRFGLSNAEIAFYTSWFYLPWVIKPLWSPFVELLATKRQWILGMQGLLGVGFALVALTLPLESYLQYSIAFFWLLAFSSATHDIAADGYYITTLRNDQQAFFVGIRSTFYRLAMLFGQGGIIILAGTLEQQYAIQIAWQITLFVLSGLMIALTIYHSLILPKTQKPQAIQQNSKALFKNFVDVFITFFRKKEILLFIAFILLYRLGEAQLVKIASLFMLDERSVGGLGLSTQQVGLVYGTVGIIALVIGGILGGVLVSRHGLKFWMWWMALAINLPDVLYIYMAWQQPESFLLINIFVAIEQFGYGFGFTAFLLYLIYIAQGEFKTAHYAIATGFMAAGMMFPGMWSGWLQEAMGYVPFFIWVVISTLPAFLIIYFIPLEKNFGKKDQ